LRFFFQIPCIFCFGETVIDNIRTPVQFKYCIR